MKRIGIVLSAILTLCPLYLTAQQTDAPDQDDTGEMDMKNSGGTVTEEKEVVATGGVLYNDGRVNYAPLGVELAVQSEDTGAGVKSIYIWVDDASKQVYSTPVKFEGEGQHAIAFQVEDNVGNLSTLKTFAFVVDAAAPEIKVVSAFKGVQMTNGMYVPADNKFSIVAQDKLSGVKSVEYAVDGQEMQAYNGEIVLVEKSGQHTISFRATDNVGNVSETASYSFFIDGTAPSVEIACDPAAFNKDGVNFISGKTAVVITAKDADTDIASIVYYVDGGEAQNYTYQFKLADGAHTIKAMAVDAVGNESEVVEYSVTVDAADPSAYVEAEK
ncbi:MAG: hypothetical protein A2Y33_07745 [Spirochaetes bacterium GWF1_51_8]|nr:MAG: hypothetical protein A2Y33_07745 [Spirochaetes bacterium GWF1_51_8]